MVTIQKNPAESRKPNVQRTLPAKADFKEIMEECPANGSGRKKAVQETIKHLLDCFEHCIDSRMFDDASDIAQTAASIAAKHGCDDLKEDAAIRYVVVNLQLGRLDELGSALSEGWLSQTDMDYITGLFYEAERKEKESATQALVPRQRTEIAKIGSVSALASEIMRMISDLSKGSESDDDLQFNLIDP